MDTSEKCELTSVILDYVWYDLLKEKDSHTITKDEHEFYTEKAQSIYDEIYDTIDNFIDEKEI